jgi:hypothetical protein
VPELTEQATSWLSVLKTTFESRRGDYEWAEVIGGYSTATATPMIAHLVIRLHPADDLLNEARTDYAHFTLFSRAINPQAAWDLFEALTRQLEVSIGTGLPPLRFGACTLDEPARWDSNSFPSSEAWPTDVGLLNGTSDGRLRHELLASWKGDIFTGPHEAITETTRVPVGYRGFSPTVFILMPDRRCRLSEPKLSSKSVSGQVVRGPVAHGSLTLRGYASPVGSAARQRERLDTFGPPSRFEIDEPRGPFLLETGFFPNHLIIALIDKGSDRVLDQREYESARLVLANDITFEADSGHIEDLIAGGESDRVEFKENFEGGEGWIKTVCAFANGEGGVIFFGVRNDTSVAGLASPKTADWITQKVRTVEPFPRYSLVPLQLQEKSVVYIDVAAGAEKPYSVQGQGVFVRAQATTRQATRHELLLLAKNALTN